jgi:hypothetical protein
VRPERRLSVASGTLSRMGRVALFNKSAVDDLVARQHGLITRSQALLCGLTKQPLRTRTRPGGSWSVLLPGIYSTFTGTPTVDQRVMAALLYAGPGSLITGQTAMAAHGMNTLERAIVDVLIPIDRRRQDHGFVHVLRTSKMPQVAYMVGELRYAPPARAVADAARQLSDLRDVRTIVAAGAQWRRLSVAELAKELEQGPTAGSARFRAVLAEVADGIRSAAEADLRKLIKRSRLPDPYYNPRLYKDQEFIAMPDAWWPEAGVAVEVDSKQWHFSPRDWEATLARHDRMSSFGITVLHYPPRRLVTESAAVAAQIRSALDVGRTRPRLDLRTVSSAWAPPKGAVPASAGS